MTTNVPPETEDETHARQALQCKWWAKLVKHTDATLHQHIAPGKLVLFGVGSEEAEYLIAPSVSLQYWVWADKCEVSLYIDTSIDKYEKPHESPFRNRKIAACERLFARKENIEASFGDALDWGNEFITYYIDGGYERADYAWDEIINLQVGAMNRLHAAVMPHVINIPFLN